MTTREEIVLKVPQDVAETYRRATEEEKAQIAARVSMMLRKKRKLRQDWAGMLKAEGHTSVEMQHLASEWRNT